MKDGTDEKQTYIMMLYCVFIVLSCFHI